MFCRDRDPRILAVRRASVSLSRAPLLGIALASAINAPRIMIATLERVFIILRLLLGRDLREQGLGIAHCQARTGITSHYRELQVPRSSSRNCSSSKCGD